MPNIPDQIASARIAVVDADPGVRELIRSALEREGLRADGFGSLSVFLDSGRPEEHPLVVCGFEPADPARSTLLRRARARRPESRVVVWGPPTIAAAVAAMKAGADDYVSRPFQIPDLVATVRRQVPRAADVEVRSSRDERSFAVGRSLAWRDLLEKARRVAELPATVLIRGETGTGKEVVAKYIVSFGPRAGRPFVSLNCAAMPESLIESELFGHVRGAFSGATSARRGLFEEASTGTLFLDEIGTMPREAQAKVLRALDEHHVRRVGDNRSIPVDVRILAATNLDIEAAVARREFRDDLYYRLAVVTLRIPPLRERPEDIVPLADHFLGLLAGGKPPRVLSPTARDLLLSYAFPGNVRELRHALEQACALSREGELTPDDFPFLSARRDFLPVDPEAPETGRADASSPRAITPQVLQETLADLGGNRVAAARQLGISRSTLYRLIRKAP